ncbi:hypothetical protein HAX54_006570 [Datura stramonium]|uniref:Uncharacterized protein n=1 Tax=Datura stramonium TaxID=4076 RepID=A0ABS8TC60_DATST|nr:hypothetical protein [Datura stramonium]
MSDFGILYEFKSSDTGEVAIVNDVQYFLGINTNFGFLEELWKSHLIGGRRSRLIDQMVSYEPIRRKIAVFHLEFGFQWWCWIRVSAVELAGNEKERESELRTIF